MIVSSEGECRDAGTSLFGTVESAGFDRLCRKLRSCVKPNVTRSQGSGDISFIPIAWHVHGTHKSRAFETWDSRDLKPSRFTSKTERPTRLIAFTDDVVACLVPTR